MKNISIVLLIIAFTSCTQREYMVSSDHAPDVEFDQYDSYYFATQARSNNTDFFLGDISLKNGIKEEIRGEMKAKGYSFDPLDPDLLVNFRVFEEPVDMQGYQQQEFDYWAEDVIDPDNQKTYNLDAGSLVVDFVDTETGRVVWTGYASGIIDGDSFDKSEKAIAAAVDELFDNYDYRANEL